MANIELPRPVNVSPLIKFSRWSFLTIGIFYGIINQKRFVRKENALREIEKAEKPIRDAKLAEEKLIRTQADNKILDEFFQKKE
uniref:ATP synthase F(0) complex subunit e, mitochondrial n=1 Tax=Ceratosolen solmsi TaxID=142686 RepID=A0A0A1CM61_9HYME|nr:mitochondrial ATP synthase subunit e [Ceratosolen solmsi]